MDGRMGKGENGMGKVGRGLRGTEVREERLGTSNGEERSLRRGSFARSPPTFKKLIINTRESGATFRASDSEIACKAFDTVHPLTIGN